MGELDVEHRSLKGIKPEVGTYEVVVVFGVGAVVAQDAGLIGEGIVVADKGAAVAEAAEVFGWEERVAAEVAHAAAGLAVVGCADGLSGVFDDVELVLFGESEDGVHVGALAEEVDWDDGFGARGDFVFGVFDIEVEGDRAGVDEHGSSAGAGDAACGGEEGEGRHEDFIAWADVEGHEGE